MGVWEGRKQGWQAAADAGWAVVQAEAHVVAGVERGLKGPDTVPLEGS